MALFLGGMYAIMFEHHCTQKLLANPLLIKLRNHIDSSKPSEDPSLHKLAIYDPRFRN
jgi:hypothetical protein